MTPGRFVLLVLGAALAVAGAVGGVNWVVDPYLVFDRPRQAGFNALKPAVETHEPWMKAYQAARVPARTLVLGSSRSDIGIDTAAAAWPGSMRPVYNLSLIGAGLEQNLKFLRGYLAVHGRNKHVRTVVVGLDFEGFLYRPQPPKATSAHGGEHAPADETLERFLAGAGQAQGPTSRALQLRDGLAATFTLDAVLDSLSTVRLNRSASGSIDLEPGGRLTEGLLRGWTESDGVGTLFAQKNDASARDLAPPLQVLGSTPGGPIRGFDALRDLFDLARQHGLELVMVVQPAHASRLELLDALGYWNEFERWKRVLADLCAQARTAGVRVEAWDFGGYEPEALEPVPVATDRRTRMKWFWDPVHYTTALGERILTTTFAQPARSATARLTPEGIDTRLQQVRADRSRYRATQREDAERTWRQVCATARCVSALPP